MKINFDNEDDDSIFIAMEVGYKALADLTTFYKKVNDEILKQLAIFEGKSIIDVKKDILIVMGQDDIEKDCVAKIRAVQEMIVRFDDSEEKKKGT